MSDIHHYYPLTSSTDAAFLRFEAMRLFEQCLAEGDDSHLVDFIERQLVCQPPRVQFLRDLANDLQQHLLSLRAHHFDARDRITRLFLEQYGIDITVYASPISLHQYHRLTPDRIMAALTETATAINVNELNTLRKTVEASLHTAAQLNNDIQMTSQLRNMVSDWLEGMNTATARHHWNITTYQHVENQSLIRH